MAEDRTPQVQICGDDLLSLAVADVREAQRIAAILRCDSFWLEVVPGLESVVVQFDAAANSADAACERMRSFKSLPGSAPHDSNDGEALVLTIPVLYGGDDGPDFARVCDLLGMSPETLVAAHTGTIHRVELLGFTPGFAYISGLDPRVEVGRLAAPRQRLPAGAVGIAGSYTGLYALPGPGGWPVIGRTAMRLFDGAKDDPFCLQPGQRVRFIADDISGR